MLKKVLKITGIVLGSIALLAVIGYMTVAYYFRYRFLKGTIVNNVDISGMDVRQANEHLLKTYIPGVDYSKLAMLFEGADGYNESVRCSEINLKADMSADLIRIMNEQKPYEWIVYCFYPVQYSAVPAVTYDDEALKNAVQKLKCIDTSSDKRNPVVEIRSDGKGYYLYDEIPDKADADKVYAAVREALGNINRSVIEVDIKDFYIAHKIPDKYRKVKTLYDKIDKVNSSAITFFDEGIKYTLNGALATTWLEKGEDGIPYTDETGNLVFDESKIEGYTDFLCDVYNTSGGEMEWKKYNGGTVTLKNQLQGYRVDVEAEAASIKEELIRGEVHTRRPLYESEGLTRGGDPIGKTYIEVDMGAQKLYYFENGELKLSSDVVTGNISKGNGTPAKMCYIYFKQRNRTLRGENYATFVNYWMAVTGHVGIHDATWRNKFGGEIYKTNGSHGCINVPKSFAAELYAVAEVGTPCILYY